MSSTKNTSSAPGSAITLRHMRAEEVAEVFGLIDPEGWNLTLPKLRRLQELTPNAFYVLVDENDTVVATFSLMPTFPDEVVLGNIVVSKSHRGLGIGRKVLTQYAQEAVKFKALSLTSVPDAKGFYEKIGMQLTEPQQNHVIFHMDVKPEEVENNMSALAEQLKSVRIGTMDQSKFDDVLAYDRKARGGYDNSASTRTVLEISHVVIAEDIKENKVVGYAASFVTQKEIVFDGIFADTEAIAMAVYSISLRAHPQLSAVKIQVPESQQTLSRFGEVKSTYTYLRFAFGSPTMPPVDRCYCVSDCDYFV